MILYVYFPNKVTEKKIKTKWSITQRTLLTEAENICPKAFSDSLNQRRPRPITETITSDFQGNNSSRLITGRDIQQLVSVTLMGGRLKWNLLGMGPLQRAGATESRKSQRDRSSLNPLQYPAARIRQMAQLSLCRGDHKAGSGRRAASRLRPDPLPSKSPWPISQFGKETAVVRQVQKQRGCGQRRQRSFFFFADGTADGTEKSDKGHRRIQMHWEPRGPSANHTRFSHKNKTQPSHLGS